MKSAFGEARIGNWYQRISQDSDTGGRQFYKARASIVSAQCQSARHRFGDRPLMAEWRKGRRIGHGGFGLAVIRIKAIVSAAVNYIGANLIVVTIGR